jgi:dihydrofolate synthase/folylpolyglutamate synthase
VDTVQSTFPPARKAIVLACSRDKDLAAITALLLPNFEMAFLTRYLSTQRSVPPEDLAELWRRGGGSCQVCQTPALAWEAARNWSEPDNLLCISGSVFFAGEMRSLVLA